MSSVQFYMPTRLVSGEGSLQKLAELAKGLGMKRLLLVSDPIISRQPFYLQAHDRLLAAGLEVFRFEDCAVDARSTHIDQQASRITSEGCDGVIAIGGGSVMCTAKGIAIVAANVGQNNRILAYEGVGHFAKPALPMIMVPTTAGSGSEVSQFTIVKDEETGRKFLAGGPGAFPKAAVLDPVVLATLPKKAAAQSAIDAMTHAVEAYFSDIASPLTDAVALEAAGLMFRSMRPSILSGDIKAQADNLLASSMANIACGNARLGLAHTLSLPLEGHLDVHHALSVGILLPRAIAFNAPAAPDRVSRLAAAFGLSVEGSLDSQVKRIDDALRSLYQDVGLPYWFDSTAVPKARMAEMAQFAVPGLYEMPYAKPVTGDTYIAAPSIRKMKVSEAEEVLLSCIS